MNRLKGTKFEKISLDQLAADEITHLEANRKLLIMPTRATEGSAGYDIHIPFDLTIEPGETRKIPTLLRCSITPGWYLMIVPRSGLGTKYRCKIDNTVGIIDSDYYGAKNEGHIWISMTNEGTKPLVLKAMDAFCQGIFNQFGITEDDHADGTRVGGFGSTSTK